MNIGASTLIAMGVELAPGPVPLPLYAQKELVPSRNQFSSDLIVYEVADVDHELQGLMSLLLQIVDGRAFRR
jgi:hypothetical protein